LVTIAIAAIDIPHYKYTELHKLFVSAVQLLGAIPTDGIQGGFTLCVQ
jgi:hypothetical protein